MHKFAKRMLGCLVVTGALALSLAPAAYAADEPGGGSASVADSASAQVVGAGDEGTAAPQAENAVDVISQGATDQTFEIGDGEAVMISGQQAPAGAPIVFENCTFNLAGGTVKISGTQQDAEGKSVSYNNGEVVTKLWIGGNVQFKNCTFVTAEGATKTTSAGYDAAIYFFGGDINLTNCTLSATGYNGQFLGLYGSDGAVTFDGCDISTTNNKNGWSYAMYAGSVLKLVNGSTMSATGMTTDGGNINCFYSGDNKTGYDAIFIEDSKVDFQDNAAGGFAINNVNIYVNNSEILVNNNKGNACNSGYWIVDNSTIQMNGNKGGHALSCIGFEMTDTKLEVLHNGYAGIYIQSKDSSLTDCTVDLRCNGEKLLSYTAGDLWLVGHKLTVSGGTSEAQPGSPWLGGVGRKGAVETTGDTTVVAYDLNSNAVDNLKSETAPVLTGAALALNDEEQDSHTLLLNPFMTSGYARGNAEGNKSDNDGDLFDDQHIGQEMTDEETGETFTPDRDYVIGGETAKIGSLTTAQLSHHKYDWENGEVTDQATSDTYGVKRYECTDVCSDYAGHTAEHANSFDCDRTYVYAPLVGVTFDKNVPEDEADQVTGMPDDQTAIEYEGTAEQPTADPKRGSTDPDTKWVFAGWFADKECTERFDFSQSLTDNWTVVYAGWIEAGVASIQPADITIYMGGDQGYEGVINGADGSYVSENSLPDPGFYFTLPDEVNDALEDAGIANADSGADLSDYLTIYTVDGQSTWKITRYGEENSAIEDGGSHKFLYRIDPDPQFEGTKPLRLQFTDTETGETYLSDEFDPAAEDALFKQYKMLIYTGELDRENIIIQIDVPGVAEPMLCVLATPEEGAGGDLTVRYVTADNPQDVVTDAIEMEDGMTDEDLNGALADLRADNPGLGIAVIQPGTTYYVNGSGIDVTVDNQNVNPSLLFDHIVSDETGEEASAFDGLLLDHALDTIAAEDGSFAVDGHEARYIDLVDANNGNAWLTTDKPVDVYWPYPEGTDENTEFRLVHFQGLDREMENGAIESEIQDATKEYVEVENTEHGIRFTAENGFSPFVLVWGTSESGPDTPSTPDEPVDSDESIPQTGDVTSFAGAAVAAAAGAALVAAGFVRMRRDA
ncbi:right-handed parallel beta-helix repeat-containing protein [Olsenella uli]|uniref:right-handed parallel beta-helix repeat-containing protein n=1 Tax=Olsenella uli TaxID=133926 RepID=UPI00195654A1|nr:right-handed parallel beta-helix repeat-containing protein [Olsenella uli]MBM6676399.1 right-handed parallel beta-helix repeat-containing protein [Olsenella uli]